MNVFVFDIETIPQRAPLSEIQEEELSKRMSRSYQDMDENERRRLIMGTTPAFGEIVCISYAKYTSKTNTEEIDSIIGEEPDILQIFWNKISSFRGRFVHYNGLSFDVPWILLRTIHHGLKPLNKEFSNTRRFQTFPHYDCKQIIADWDWKNSISLQLACDFFGVPSPKEGEIKAQDVAQAFEDGRIKAIAEYCERDVIATAKVYKKLLAIKS